MDGGNENHLREIKFIIGLEIYSISSLLAPKNYFLRVFKDRIIKYLKIKKGKPYDSHLAESDKSPL